MSGSGPGRIRGIAVLAGLVSGVAGGARAEPSALAPIDPFCHPAVLGQCVSVGLDQGIYYLPGGELHPDRGLRPPESPWNGAGEVGYAERALVCGDEAARIHAPGCIDFNELIRIVPTIELPGDQR